MQIMKNIRYSVVSAFIRKMSKGCSQDLIFSCPVKYWPVFALRVANPGLTGEEMQLVCKFFTKKTGYKTVLVKSSGNLIYLDYVREFYW